MQQASLFFSRFRFVWASILAMTFLVLVSALVTAIGSNTILDTKTHPHVTITGASMVETPNAVTVGINNMIASTERGLLAAGKNLYGACKGITTTTAQTGRAIAHGSAVTIHAIGTGVTTAARGIASGTVFIVRGYAHGVVFATHTAATGAVLPIRLSAKVVEPIQNAPTVSALLRPADDRAVPIISNKTSADTLALLDAQQRQQIESWQNAQLAANQKLAGAVVAGDPAHGGYPAKWDNAPQDSMVDQWGMYSRECVSYAAWKVYQAYGNMPYWGGVGNANQWVRDARRAAIPTGSTPQPRSVAISMAGYYGHAMWVEKVSGNMVYVSQYNYDLHGHYSEMWVDGSHFTYIYFK